MAKRRIAMLIDGDNAQYKLLKEMIEEVSRYGTVTVRRAYGDWTQPELKNWRDVMLTHAIHPIQQWRFTTGKNATDSSLIIDAMDILYSGTVHGFCIVSSDSDYTRLCTRIREAGLFVMGIGRKLTPDAFVNACDVFVHIENLTNTPNPQKVNQQEAKLIGLLERAFDIAGQENDWVNLGALGSALHQIDPSFDSRTYGHKRLSELVKSMQKYVEVRHNKKTGPSTVFVRSKNL